MAKFEGQERRMPKIEACLKEYGMASLEEARSSLGWSQMRMCGAVERLREHLEAYEKI